MVDIEQLNWTAATRRFVEVREPYLFNRDLNDDQNAALTLRMIFEPLAMRYGRGERSLALYQEMMTVE